MRCKLYMYFTHTWSLVLRLSMNQLNMMSVAHWPNVDVWRDKRRDRTPINTAKPTVLISLSCDMTWLF